MIYLRAAYNQIIIDKDSRKYTAFSCSLGNFEYCRLPFGLKLSGNFFNYLVNSAVIKDEVLSRSIITFVDDIFLFTKTLQEHLDVMERLFKALRESGLKIHHKKCSLLQRKVHFIGHVFGKEGVEPEPGKIDAMQSFPRPLNKKALKSFIGLVSYYRSFIKNLSHDLCPLLELLKKGEKFLWTEEKEKAFLKIKNKLKNLPTLAYADESKDAPPLILQTDASSKSIAGVLSQKTRDGASEKLIACYGRNLRENELAWDIGHKEILAMIVGVIKFRHIIAGKKLIVRSDNLSVKYFNTIKGSSNSRLVRWNLYLADILSNTTFEYVQGESNFVDALSRRTYETNDPPTEQELEILHDDFTIRSLSPFNMAYIMALHNKLSEELLDDEEEDDEDGVIRNFEKEDWFADQEEEYEENDGELLKTKERQDESDTTETEEEQEEGDKQSELGDKRGKRRKPRRKRSATNERYINSVSEGPSESGVQQVYSIEYHEPVHKATSADDKQKYARMIELQQQRVQTMLGQQAFVPNQHLESSYLSAITRTADRKNVNLTGATVSDTLDEQEALTEDTAGPAYSSVPSPIVDPEEEQPTAEVDMTECGDSCTQEMADETKSATEAEFLTTTIFQIVGTDSNFQKLQEQCEEIGPLIRYLQTGEIATDPKIARRIQFDKESHFLDEQGVLCKFKINSNPRTRELTEVKEFKVIPVILRRDVLELLHGLTHYGIGRMLTTLDCCGYQWSGMYRDIRKFVLSCEDCRCSKRGLFRNKIKLKPLPIPSRCMETIHIDVVGPLSESEQGSKFLLTVVDSFSGYIWIYPIKEQNSEVIAEKLLHVFSQVGLPDRLISDLGTPLISQTMQLLWKMLNVKHVTTAAFNQKANSKIERKHRVISDTLRALLQSTEVGKWEKQIVLIEWALRTGATPVSPFSPSEILHDSQAEYLYKR